MKTPFLAIALFFTAAGCSAQQIQTRAVSPFSKIETSGSVYVVYTTSDTLDLRVKAKDNEMENIDTKVVNSTLVISNHGKFKEPVYVYVKNSRLVSVECTGASDFHTTNTIKGDSIRFEVTGAADVHAAVDVKVLQAIQSGAGDLNLTGTTDQLKAEITGASTLKAYNLISKNADVSATSASTAKINVTEKLKANASGASTIRIKGDAKEVNAESTSASSITRIADTGNKDANGDTTFYNWRHKKIIIVQGDSHEEITMKDTSGFDAGDFRHWAGFFVGVNGYMNQPGSITMPAKYGYMDLDYNHCFNFQLNVIERQFNIVKNNFKIITGLGFDFHQYAFSNKTNLNPDSSFTYGRIDSTNQYSYHKNKLRNTYIQVPLLLEFNTSNHPYKTFHMAIGVIGQYMIASRTKQVLENEDYTFTKVRKDSYNMSPFAAKAHLNMGYRGWTIYAEYSLTPLFQSGKGPELYPFAAGIRVVPFT